MMDLIFKFLKMVEPVPRTCAGTLVTLKARSQLPELRRFVLCDKTFTYLQDALPPLVEIYVK